MSKSLLPIEQLRSLAEKGEILLLEKYGRNLLLANPLQDEVLSWVAYSLQQQSRLDEAAVFASQSVDINPDRWLSQFIAGVSFKGLGQHKKSCEFLRQALKISPQDQQTLRELIKSIAIEEGIDTAATEYRKHNQKIDASSDLVIAEILTVRDWSEKTGSLLLEVGEVEQIPFKAPHVWGSPKSDELFNAPSNKPYVAEIQAARIFSNSSIILTADGTALSDIGGHPQFGPYVNFVYEKIVLAQQPGKLLLNFNEFQTRSIDCGILMSGLASSHFGHWLPEFLPKLQFLQHHPDFASLPLIVDAGMPQSHFDHLQRIASNPLILLQENESLLCKRLLVAPSPAFFPTESLPNEIPVYEIPGLSPRAMDFIRANDKFANQEIPHKRLFLTRKNQKWRKLINEKEIESDLVNLGFEAISIEEMTVSSQITLFRQAEWIVAANGSALLNLIFSGPEVKLLVLTQPNLFNWGTFQGPMDYLGYQSMVVAGDYAVAAGEKHSDYRVPPEHIRQALFHLGMKEALVCNEEG